MSQQLEEPIQRLPMDPQTELMLKYGPKDICYAALYDAKDIIHIQKLSKQIHAADEQGKERLTKYFFDQLEKRWNDHDTTLEIGNEKVKFLQVSKAGDIVTIQGLQFCCRMVITSGLAPWRYHGVGNSTLEARAYQQKLFTETEPRADMTIVAQGSIARVNQSMRFIGIFPASFPTITVRESGVFNINTAYTGTMLNRQMFSSTPITHVVSGTAFTVATLINFTSVTTYG